MRKKFISLALATTLCLGLAIPASAAGGFSDVPTSHWAVDKIYRVNQEGVMNGISANVFNPSGKLTLAQWMVILTRGFYGDEVNASSATGNWYAKNYEVALQHNLLDNIFYDESTGIVNSWSALGPEEMLRQNANACTRAQAATMVYNIMRDKGLSTPTQETLKTIKDGIPDLYTVWYAQNDSVATCYYYNILTGVDSSGVFDGNNSLNRAQAAAIFCRAEDAFKNQNPTTTPTNPTQTPTQTQTPNQDDQNKQEPDVSIKPVPSEPDSNPNPAPDSSKPVGNTLQSMREGVLELVNAARAENGAGPLTLNDALCDVAQLRADEIVKSFSHTRPNGSSCFTALKEAGISYWTTAENIAAGASTPAEVMNMWMNSSGHRANILNGSLKEIGIGYVKTDSGYGSYWVQMFIG